MHGKTGGSMSIFVHNRAGALLCVVAALVLSAFSLSFGQGAAITQSINGTTFEMRSVEGGTYNMGCTTGDNDCDAQEKPQHSVTVSDFHIGKYAVTRALWAAVMGKAPGYGTDNQPVTSVDWYNAQAFACSLSTKTGRNYRLATEAEWEFAARGGNTGKSKNNRYSGSNTVGDVAVCGVNSVANVGTKAANELGLYDMSGNVWEWTYDSYHNGSYFQDGQTNPTGPVLMHTQKVRRGGTANAVVKDCRVSSRFIRSIEGKDGALGLRIALSNSFPAGMAKPCDIQRPIPPLGKGTTRDNRLVTGSDTAWVYEFNYGGMSGAYVLKIWGNGAVQLSLIMEINGQRYVTSQASGEWYTLNDFSLNIVSTGSNRTTTTFPYFLITYDLMSIISEGGSIFGRFERMPVSTVAGASGVTAPTIPNTSLSTLVPANSTFDMSNPPTTGRDSRLIEGVSQAWLQDNVALNAGGTHRYRFDFDTQDSALFVVYDASQGSSVKLASGRWFTVGNTFLRITHRSGQTYDYLYTVNDTSFMHLSFQGYEPGDMRTFKKVSASAVPQWKEPTMEPYVNDPDGGSTYIPPDPNAPDRPTGNSSSSGGGSSSSGGTNNQSSSSGTNSNVTQSSSGGVSPIRIPQIANGPLFGYATGKTIVLGNIPNGAKIDVYNIHGKRVHSATSQFSTSQIEVQAKGIYFVKVNNQALRIPVM
jgi:formylglycine-generating enzyme required for sulfatase activity